MRNLLISPPQFSLAFSEPYLRFVLHKHLANRLHYDLRLELDGRLLDWALPKGPSLNPFRHRLAIRRPDHAKSCLQFEGRIRPGAYGAGPLLIGDFGYYAPLYQPNMSHEEAIWQSLQRGQIHLVFYGFRLKGSWTFKRFNDDWLLNKKPDAFASCPGDLSFEPSVLTGRTLDQI